MYIIILRFIVYRTYNTIYNKGRKFGVFAIDGRIGRALDYRKDIVSGLSIIEYEIRFYVICTTYSTVNAITIYGVIGNNTGFMPRLINVCIDVR